MNTQHGKRTSVEYCYKWDNRKAETFLHELSNESLQLNFHTLSENLSTVTNTVDLGENLNGFYQRLLNVCDPLFKAQLRG